jgi:hypothetical protein
MALCHLTIVPVYPDRVNNPLVDPVQTEVPPDTEPPIEAGVTVIVITLDSAAPFQSGIQVTRAIRLYQVVWIIEFGL